MLFEGSARADGESWQHNRRSLVPAQPRPDARRAFCGDGMCVHVAKSTRLEPGVVRRAFDAAQRARAALESFDIPPAKPDGGRGGGLELDVYLDHRAVGAASYADPHPLTHWDRTSAYAVIGMPLVEAAGCRFDTAVTRAVAQAMLLGLDAAQHEGTLAMHSSYLASRIAPCSSLELEAIDRFQRTPERALSDGDRRFASGSMLFPWFVDAAWGAGSIGAMMTGLIATSCQLTPVDRHRWLNEPDIYDALRTVMPTRNQQLGDVLLNFAIARAFIGDRSDGQHLPDTERFGAMGRVGFQWAIDYDSLPRRLAPLVDVYSTGASYLWLDTSGADPHAGLFFLAEWESSRAYQWALIRLDAQGRELGRSTTGGVFGHDRAEVTITDIDDAAAILMVGTHLGDDDRAHPFDPDDGTPQQAGYTVTLHRK